MMSRRSAEDHARGENERGASIVAGTVVVPPHQRVGEVIGRDTTQQADPRCNLEDVDRVRLNCDKWRSVEHARATMAPIRAQKDRGDVPSSRPRFGLAKHPPRTEQVAAADPTRGERSRTVSM